MATYGSLIRGKLHSKFSRKLVANFIAEKSEFSD
ncbi:unnamed protein product [Arabidopsis halleri]